MEKKFQQSKEKVDKSALKAIQVLLSYDLIKSYKEKNYQDFEHPEPRNFDPLKSLSLIESRFLDILEIEITKLPKTSYKIKKVIDKYIILACAKYNTKMAETIEKLTNIGQFISKHPYRFQNEEVENDRFRFEWCKPFTIKNNSKKLLLEEFDQTKEVDKLWKILVRTKGCNDKVMDAWCKLVNRPDREIKQFLSAELQLLNRIATVECPNIVDVEGEFFARRKEIEVFDRCALNIEILLSDDVIMKKKVTNRELWFETDTHNSWIGWSFIRILGEMPDLLERSQSEFEKIMDKYIYTPCAKYDRPMRPIIAKLDHIARFVSIGHQKETVQNGWYRFKWCQQLYIEETLRYDLEYELLKVFMHHKKPNLKSDDSNKSTQNPDHNLVL